MKEVDNDNNNNSTQANIVWPDIREIFFHVYYQKRTAIPSPYWHGQAKVYSFFSISLRMYLFVVAAVYFTYVYN